MTINNIYRHIVALGAVALILGAGVAHAQSFIYGNSAGNGMYKIDANTGVVAAACGQTKGNGRGIKILLVWLDTHSRIGRTYGNAGHQWDK